MEKAELLPQKTYPFALKLTISDLESAYLLWIGNYEGIIVYLSWLRCRMDTSEFLVKFRRWARTSGSPVNIRSKMILSRTSINSM